MKSELPVGWMLCSIKDIFIEVKDRVVPESDDVNYIGLEHLKKRGGIIYIGKSEGLKSQKTLFKKGDVLYGKLRPYLDKHALVSFSGICSTDIIAYRSPNSNLGKLLDGFLGTQKFIHFAINNSKGINLPRISPKVIGEVKFPLPPLQEQHRIVQKLDALLGKVKTAQERLDKIPAILKSFRQSVLAQAFNLDECERLELSKVCFKIQDGAHHSPKITYPEKDIKLYLYITSKNIRNNFMKLSNVVYVDENFHNSIYPRCNPEFGDVLLTKDGANTGNVTLNELKEPFSLLSSVCLFKTNKELLMPAFLKYYIQSPTGFSNMTGGMTGTAIKRIVLRKIKSTKIPVPSLTKQKEIVNRIESLFALADRIEARYQATHKKVSTLPQAILAKAFRGELVPQDPNDEPASVLLERIAALKAEQATTKKKKGKKK